jgi:hypothetical protein
MLTRNMKRIVIALGVLATTAAFAQQDPSTDSASPPSALHLPTTNSQPGAYQNDPSAPIPNIGAEISPLQVDNQPVTTQSNTQWQAYDQPIRHCVEGNSIIPSNGNDLFGFLFGTNAQTNVNMAIIGWKKNQCAINFIEGSQVLYCRFSKPLLDQLMHSLLYDDQFDKTGNFAQTLTQVCQSTDPDQQSPDVAIATQ